MGRFQRAPFLPSSALTIPAVACQPAVAPPKPAQPSRPAETKPATPVATAAPAAAATARPAEAPKPPEAARPVAATPTSQTAGKPQAGGTLRVARSGDLLTLDPQTSSSSFDRQLYQRVFDIVDDMPLVFIQHRPEVKVMLPTAQGFGHVPDGLMRFGRVSSKRSSTGQLGRP